MYLALVFKANTVSKIVYLRPCKDMDGDNFHNSLGLVSTLVLISGWVYSRSLYYTPLFTDLVEILFVDFSCFICCNMYCNKRNPKARPPTRQLLRLWDATWICNLFEENFEQEYLQNTQLGRNMSCRAMGLWKILI